MESKDMSKMDSKDGLTNDELSKIYSILDNYRNVESEQHVAAPANRDVEIDDELIGEDDDEITMLYNESEKISEKLCKNILSRHSVKVNTKNISIMEKAKFTAEELTLITNRYNEIHSAADEANSLKENLVSYYMSTDPTLTKDDAERDVSGLMSGVENLTSKFHAAMAEGFDPKTHINSMVEGMNLQQRYDFLINALSIATTLNVQTMGGVSDIENSLTESIEKLKEENQEISVEVCDTLQESLSELLLSSPLMLTNADHISEMMNAAKSETATVVDFTSSQYDDFRHKNEMALATWIEHRNGSLTTLPENIMPEALGVSIAAGVEEARIMEEVASGSKGLDWAIKCLKVLGAIALICFLGYIAFIGLALVAGLFFEAGIIVMGTSAIAIFAASVLAFLACWGYSDVVIKAATKIVEWSADAYDWITTKFKECIYPAIESGVKKIIAWIKSLFGGSNNNNAQKVLA